MQQGNQRALAAAAPAADHDFGHRKTPPILYFSKNTKDPLPSLQAGKRASLTQILSPYFLFHVNNFTYEKKILQQKFLTA
ncbi:hypothetical protein [Desulfofundulus sp.]|uniref:hypothetical protein n=1 Tax=Desulfofundulus sp. TaxID=2282750 RepID=UPI003C751F57